MRSCKAVLFLLAACSGAGKSSVPASPPPEHPLPLTREAAAEIVDLYLASYAKPIADGGGQADLGAWQIASEKELQYDTSAYPGGSLANVVANAMDVAFGFDFQHPARLDQDMCDQPERDARRGNLRLIVNPEAALDLLEAVRRALREGVSKNDLREVKAAIEPFWAGPNWYYEPAHTGRCYPHGHTDVEWVTPSECVISELEGLVSFVETYRTAASPAEGRLTEANSCNCYRSEDCGRGYVCNYGTGCTYVGKADGSCWSFTEGCSARYCKFSCYDDCDQYNPICCWS